MSFPAGQPTNYSVDGKDLSLIFKPLSGTQQTTQPPYNVIYNGITYNLSSIFQKLTINSAELTKFTFNGNTDLNTLYESINGYSILNYNPWTQVQTGWTYDIFNVSVSSFTFSAEAQSAETVHFILIGGGGGGASGETYEGGGGGGGVTISSCTGSQLTGSYNVTIGAGGSGGNKSNGGSGGSTSITGANLSLTATGGGGGTRASSGNIGGAGGSGGGGGSTIIYSGGAGGTNNAGINGSNGPSITFQDGSPNPVIIGAAGGGRGGRNSTSGPGPYGLGGNYGGGQGWDGIVNGDPGQYYSYQNLYYNTGSGGGGGGNNGIHPPTAGGTGNSGLLVAYYQPILYTVSSGTSYTTLKGDNNWYVIQFTSSGTITFNFAISAYYLIVGAGGNGEAGTSGGQFSGGGGGGGGVLTNATNNPISVPARVSNNINISSGLAGSSAFEISVSNGQIGGSMYTAGAPNGGAGGMNNIYNFNSPASTPGSGNSIGGNISVNPTGSNLNLTYSVGNGGGAGATSFLAGTSGGGGGGGAGSGGASGGCGGGGGGGFGGENGLNLGIGVSGAGGAGGSNSTLARNTTLSFGNGGGGGGSGNFIGSVLPGTGGSGSPGCVVIWFQYP